VVRAVALGRGNVKPGEPLHENTNNGRKRRKTGGYGNVA
jgi:hypothetical protein